MPVKRPVMIRATTKARVFGGRQISREGHHDLSGHRGQTDGHRGHLEEPEVGCHGAGDQGDGGETKDQRDQTPAGVEIAQRHHQHEAGGDRWVQVMTTDAAAAPTWKVRATSCNRGWA